MKIRVIKEAIFPDVSTPAIPAKMVYLILYEFISPSIWGITF